MQTQNMINITYKNGCMQHKTKKFDELLRPWLKKQNEE